MIVRVHAGWLVPIAAPVLRDGWIDVDARRGEIVAVGAADAVALRPAPGMSIDLREAIILPGLVNAHTHLELSHLAGAVPPADAFVSWVRSMLAVRFGAPVAPAVVSAAIGAAIASMEATGTIGVGDIGNTDAAVSPLAASSLSGVHFREALAFRRADAERVASDTLDAVHRTHAALREAGHQRLTPSAAPHAPYSTSAPLIRALAQGNPPACAVSSLHLAESPEEVEFLAHGRGPFRELLADLGAWDEGWEAPGCTPVDYIDGLGALHAGLLVVHGTQLATRDLRAVAAAGATLVLCPRSNRWVGTGVPPATAAFEVGGRVALGTDSLASVEDLNLFAELAFLRRLAPQVPAGRLLRAATLGGARALGLGDLGVLAPGATSRALVRIPPAQVVDVEEWLVAEAADTADLRWLDEIVARAAS